MPVVSKEILKSYFQEDEPVPVESNYVDLIDTMGDMSKSQYDANSNNIVDNSEALGGVAAANYLQRVSANRPGVIKLYRRETDDGYSLQTYWASPYWIFQGYTPSNSYHAGVRVAYADLAAAAPWAGITGKPSTYPPSTHTHGGGDITSAVASATNADTVDLLHATAFYRNNANFSTSGYLDTSSYVDAVGGFRINGQPTGGLVLYTTAQFKSHTSYDGDTVGIGAYTLTPAMFGYPSTAKALYLLLQGKGVSGIGWAGINNLSSSYNYPIGINTPTDRFESQYGITHLDGSGNMYLRLGTATAQIIIQIWGYFI